MSLHSTYDTWRASGCHDDLPNAELVSKTGRREHEIKIGMSVYWTETWPEADGYAFSARAGAVSGWSKGNRADAVAAARDSLRVVDAAERVIR